MCHLYMVVGGGPNGPGIPASVVCVLSPLRSSGENLHRRWDLSHGEVQCSAWQRWREFSDGVKVPNQLPFS